MTIWDYLSGSPYAAFFLVMAIGWAVSRIILAFRGIDTA